MSVFVVVISQTCFCFTVDLSSLPDELGERKSSLFTCQLTDSFYFSNR